VPRSLLGAKEAGVGIPRAALAVVVSKRAAIAVFACLWRRPAAPLSSSWFLFVICIHALDDDFVHSKLDLTSVVMAMLRSDVAGS
jgi:hypothetical protein